MAQPTAESNAEDDEQAWLSSLRLQEMINAEKIIFGFVGCRSELWGLEPDSLPQVLALHRWIFFEESVHYGSSGCTDHPQQV